MGTLHLDDSMGAGIHTQTAVGAARMINVGGLIDIHLDDSSCFAD
jgi:hypothetical protein